MGGTWTSQNKVRPGAYLNFTSVAQPSMTVGDRGIGTMAIPLSWGAEGELIEVLSSDLSTGASLATVGVTAFDDGAKLLNLMLSNCYKALIYRLNTGGVKATGTGGALTVTAKYSGTLGNAITVTITEADGVFTVTTFVNGASKDSQPATTIAELVDNDFVTFSGTGDLTASAGITLIGGTDGSYTASTAYPAYLDLASRANWQVMALTQDNDAYAAQFATFVDDLRNNEGKYCQVVVSNYAADSVSVINSDCGAVVDGVTVTAEEATAWVAGITAGASVTQSNVGKAFTGATKILNERTNTEIIKALESGMFVLSTNTAGQIVVEDDINSLRTFTSALSEDFRLNQVIRVLDEIGTSLQNTWEQSFKGKVQNNENRRNVFKSVVIGYMEELQNMGAIEDFDDSEDITVEAGTAKDAVTLTLNADPVVAMSKLYGLVYVL